MSASAWLCNKKSVTMQHGVNTNVKTFFFIVIKEFVYFATYFDQLGHLQVLHTMYGMLWEQIISIQYYKMKRYLVFAQKVSNL
jgi:hypothetical protein